MSSLILSIINEVNIVVFAATCKRKFDRRFPHLQSY